VPAQPANARRVTTVAAVLMIAFMLHSPLVTGNAVTMVPPRIWGSQPMPMTSGRLGPKRLPVSSRSSIPQSPPLDEWDQGPTADRGLADGEVGPWSNDAGQRRQLSCWQPSTASSACGLGG